MSDDSHTLQGDSEGQHESAKHSDIKPVHAAPSKPFVWTTLDGRKLQPKDMGYVHIQNCIRHLESQIIDPWTVHGDEPKYGAGGYMDSVMNDNNERLERSIKIFKNELARRGGVIDLVATGKEPK